MAVAAFAVPGLALVVTGHLGISVMPWLLFGLASAYVWRVSENAGWRLDSFRSGVVVTSPDGLMVFRWDSSTVLQYTVLRHRRDRPQAVRYGYVLIDPHGFALWIGRGFSRRSIRSIKGALAHTVVRGPAFAYSERWGAAVERGVLDAHLPRADDALRAGRVISFGNARTSPSSTPWRSACGPDHRRRQPHRSVA